PLWGGWPSASSAGWGCPKRQPETLALRTASDLPTRPLRGLPSPGGEGGSHVRPDLAFFAVVDGVPADVGVLLPLRAHVAEPERAHLAHLDLLRAFGDPVAAVVAVDVLERLVARVADAAVRLHGPVGGVAAEPVADVVAHRDLVGDLPLHLAVRHPVDL